MVQSFYAASAMATVPGGTTTWPEPSGVIAHAAPTPCTRDSSRMVTTPRMGDPRSLPAPGELRGLTRPAPANARWGQAFVVSDALLNRWYFANDASTLRNRMNFIVIT